MLKMSRDTMQRNEMLNVIKAIMAYLIIAIHCKFPGAVGNGITIVARIGVPFFFMISGYYAYPLKRIKFKIIRIIKIAILMEIIYICASSNSCTLLDLVHTYVFPDFVMLILGVYGKCGGGWFVYALLEAYLIWWCVYKIKAYKVAYIYTVISLCIHIYMQYTLDFSYDFWTSNVILTGFPFFMLGVIIKEKINMFTGRTMWLIGTAVGIVVSLVEGKFIKSDLYIGTIVASICLFIFCQVNSTIKGEMRIFSEIGDKLSVYIYIYINLL